MRDRMTGPVLRKAGRYAVLAWIGAFCSLLVILFLLLIPMHPVPESQITLLAILAMGASSTFALFWMGYTMFRLSAEGITVTRFGKTVKTIPWAEIPVIYVFSDDVLANDSILLAKHEIRNPFGCDPADPSPKRLRRVIHGNEIHDWMVYSRKKEAALRQFVPDKLRNWDQSPRQPVTD